MGILLWLALVGVRPPPPPPPPPPMPRMDLPAPSEIVDFVRAHAGDAQPWQVTLYELDEGTAKPRFMGAHVRKARALSRAASVQLIANLLRPIYANGDCGCWTNVSLGIRIERGQATLDLVYNSAHLMMTPAWHDGRFVTLAETEWLDKLSSERLRRRR